MHFSSLDRKTQRLVASIVFAFVALAFLFFRGDAGKVTPNLPEPSPVIATSTTEQGTSTVSIVVTTTNAFVTRAVDGDTIEVKLDNEVGDFKVRLLGVNTPESVDPRRPVECFGKEASKHTKELAEGKRVRLEEDPQADERDVYGRLLRNVVLEDGTDLNAALVRDGYAYAYLSFPLNKKRKAEFKRLEGEAKAEERGLWSPETCRGTK